MSLIALIPGPIRAWLGRRWALRQLPSSLAAGDLCSVVSDDETFGVVKVLAVDPDGFHVRIYREKFQWRPLQARSSDLSLGSVNDPQGFGMGHLPLSRAAFGAWQPVFICREALVAEELDGYRMWQDASGGYFG